MFDLFITNQNQYCDDSYIEQIKEVIREYLNAPCLDFDEIVELEFTDKMKQDMKTTKRITDLNVIKKLEERQ